MKKNRVPLPYLILLPLAVLIYTCAGIVGKYASNYPLFSIPFLACYCGEVIILGIYAIIWQKLIQKIDLSIAYANRSINLLWALLFAVLLFHEKVTANNIIGVIVVMIGIFFVNSGNNHTGGTHES